MTSPQTGLKSIPACMHYCITNAGGVQVRWRTEHRSTAIAMNGYPEARKQGAQYRYLTYWDTPGP